MRERESEERNEEGGVALVAAIMGGPLWDTRRWLLLGAGILVVGDAVYLFVNGVRGSGPGSRG